MRAPLLQLRAFLAGGTLRASLGPLSPLFNRVTKAYLIGDAAEAFSRTLQGKAAYEISGTLDEAVSHAYQDAKASGEDCPIILLSPACASFDQFKDFEARGEAFRHIVQDLGGNALVSVKESA